MIVNTLFSSFEVSFFKHIQKIKIDFQNSEKLILLLRKLSLSQLNFSLLKNFCKDFKLTMSIERQQNNDVLTEFISLGTKMNYLLLLKEDEIVSFHKLIIQWLIQNNFIKYLPHQITSSFLRKFQKNNKTLNNDVYQVINNRIQTELMFIDTDYSCITQLIASTIPHENFNNDVQLQKVIFNMMKKNTKCFNLSCSFYEILFRNNLTLKIDICQFIECFFQKLNITVNNYSDEICKKLEEKKLNKMNKIEYILVCLLFKEEYINYRETINNLFVLLIQKLIKNFETKYEYKIIKFLRKLFYQIGKILCKKQYNPITQRYSTIIYNYHEKKDYYNRFTELINNYLLSIIEYLFFHKIKRANFILSIFFEINAHNENYINFDIESNFNKLYQKNNKYTVLFVKNIKASLPFILSQMHTNPKIKDFFIKTIKDINNTEPKKTDHITKHYSLVLSMIYYFAAEEKSKNLNLTEIDKEYYNFLCEYSPNIMQTILPWINLSENAQIELNKVMRLLGYSSFLLQGFFRLLSDNQKEILKQMYSTYQLNNIHDYISYSAYDFLIDQTQFWNYFYNQTVRYEPNINIDIKPHCLYSNEIIKHLSLPHIPSIVKYSLRSFSSLLKIDYNNIDFYKKIIYNVVYTFTNNFKKSLHVIFSVPLRIAQDVLKNICDEERIINKSFDNIVYPPKEALEFILMTYNDLILPYYDYIKKNILQISQIDSKILFIFTYFSIIVSTTNFINLSEIEEKDVKSNSKCLEYSHLFSEIEKFGQNFQEMEMIIINELSNIENKTKDQEELFDLNVRNLQNNIYFHFGNFKRIVLPKKVEINRNMIKIYCNIFWNKIENDSLEKYEILTSLYKLIQQSNHKDNVFFGNLKLISTNQIINIQQNFKNDISQEYIEFTPYSFQSENSIQSNLKIILESIYKILEKKSEILVDESKKIEKYRFINILQNFLKISLLMTNEYQCDSIYLIKMLGKLGYLLLLTNFDEIDILENFIKEMNKELKIFFNCFEELNPKIDYNSSQKLLIFTQTFLDIISDFDKTNSPNKNSHILLYFIHMHQFLSYNYLFFIETINNDMNHKKIIYKIEKYICDKCFDSEVPSNIKIGFVYVLYSLLHKKFKYFTNYEVNQFSLTEILNQDKNKLKNISYSELKKTKQKKYIIKSISILEELKINISYNSLIELLLLLYSLYKKPLTFKEYSNKMLSKKYRIINFSQRKITKLIFYLIIFGYLKSDTINIKELINIDQDWQNYTGTFEIVTALCYYEIIYNNNYHVVNIYINQLLYLFNISKNNNYIDELKSQFEIFFKFLSKKITIYQIEELILDQIKNNINYKEEIYLIQINFFGSKKCNAFNLLFNDKQEIKLKIEQNIIQYTKNIVLTIDKSPKNLDIIIQSIYTYSYLVNEQNKIVEITKNIIIPNINQDNSKVLIIMKINFLSFVVY